MNKKDKYVLIKAKELLGIGLIIFAKDSLKDRISKVSYDTVKLGFMGSIANKGAVIIKMHVDDSIFCFSSVHFEHGVKSLNTRLLNL